ncbi:ATP-binding protein [Lacinutrix sp. Hel_I_90]|uniref:tetratricopeptide repeat-containing hybrid sensor histidine kinase/response regulator n=1 Tax=Lacinutrix sp. Hel_I_90 TaxID=1249999 RepID=UPI0009E298A7|nr:ATP-binding protein [Lacinutrix sp. Hel_I_90]
MDKKTLLTITLIFQFAIYFAQSDYEYSKTKRFSDLQEEVTPASIDSLIKHVLRKSYYAKDYAKTIDEGHALIKKAEQIEYYQGISSISSILGNTFLQINDTVAAKKLFTKQLVQAQTRKDSLSYLGASIDLANVYINQEEYDKAIDSYKEVLPYAEKIKDTIRLFILNYNISELYLDKAEVSKAEEHIDEIGKYVVALKAEPFKAGYEQIFGRFLYLKNKSEEAIPHLKKAIEISKAINYTDGLIDAYTYYALSESKLGNYEKAFELQQDVDKYKKEKYNTDKIEAVEMVTAKFNVEQYKQELKAKELQTQLIEQEVVKNEKVLMWVLIGSSALGLLLISLLVSYVKRKKLLNDLKEKNIKYLLAKEKSEELANAKSLFFSNISHELRTPLYGIIGLSSILMDDVTLEEQKEDVKSLKFSADYLLSLINDVLQISKLDAKKEKTLGKVTFNLRELVSGIMKSFEFLKVQNTNTFNVNISKNTPNILIGDDVKLSQILINLVGNACKFTENGIISLEIESNSAGSEAANITFKIKDTGIGIPLSKQHEIFDEFTQVSNDGEYQGTGLGLPIVKKLLELHESEITLESEEGKGTQVSFTITYAISEDNYKASKEIILLPKISINNKTILVVDDNRINRIVTQKMLEKYKAKPLVAESGERAIEIVKEEEIDLILMDINMPGMNGLETTEAIRAFNSDVPVIALTAVEIEEMRDTIENSTICDIIIKPYDELVFVETILKHM